MGINIGRRMTLGPFWPAWPQPAVPARPGTVLRDRIAAGLGRFFARRSHTSLEREQRLRTYISRAEADQERTRVRHILLG